MSYLAFDRRPVRRLMQAFHISEPSPALPEKAAHVSFGVISPRNTSRRACTTKFPGRPRAPSAHAYRTTAPGAPSPAAEPRWLLMCAATEIPPNTMTRQPQSTAIRMLPCWRLRPRAPMVRMGYSGKASFGGDSIRLTQRALPEGEDRQRISTSISSTSSSTSIPMQ
jgi:hypothetical protein